MPKKTEAKDTQSTQPEQVQQVRISDILPFKESPVQGGGRCAHAGDCRQHHAVRRT